MGTMWGAYFPTIELSGVDIVLLGLDARDKYFPVSARQYDSSAKAKMLATSISIVIRFIALVRLVPKTGSLLRHLLEVDCGLLLRVASSARGFSLWLEVASRTCGFLARAIEIHPERERYLVLNSQALGCTTI